MKSDGFNTTIVSVDVVNRQEKVNLPYHYFKSAIYERRVSIYSKCDLLTEEILGLEKLSTGKIEHPDAGKHGSKDQCDAFCGALYLASKYADEYSYNYGDNLSAALEANDTAKETHNKRQMIESFEAELKAINLELAKVEEEHRQQEVDDFNFYRDLSDGIIII